MYTQQINSKQQQVLEYKSYLKNTDYTDHRQHDDPESIMPEAVRLARINARAEINRLEAEITELEALQQELEQNIEP